MIMDRTMCNMKRLFTILLAFTAMTVAAQNEKKG